MRHGNVHSADDWRSVLEPIVKRYENQSLERFFRGDAAFAKPDIFECLEAEGFYYAIRMKGNNLLYGEIEHLLNRPLGRPSFKPKIVYESLEYQAQSWKRPRRIVAKIEWHSGELFPRVGFIVPNLNWYLRAWFDFTTNGEPPSNGSRSP